MYWSQVRILAGPPVFNKCYRGEDLIFLKKSNRGFWEGKKRLLEKKYAKFYKKYKKIKPPINQEIKKLIIDTSYYHTDMCELSLKLTTDRSPYNVYGHMGHRHAYTGIYDYLFKNFRYENLNICEIGVLYNEGIKLFREYFINSKIYGFDFDNKYLEEAKNDKFKDVFYDFMDVRNKKSIINAFEKLKISFDIIIDDSTHNFQDQVNIINSVYPFLKTNGYLVIEDIYKNRPEYSEIKYYNEIKDKLHNFSDYYFIESLHNNEWSPFWNNSKIFVLKKK